MPSFDDDKALIPEDDGNVYMTTKEAAEYLRLHPGTLNNWRQWDKGPAFVRYGRIVRYRRRDLDHWLYYEDTRTD